MAEQSLTLEQTTANQSIILDKQTPLIAPVTEQEEPYASVIGAFKNDPMLDAMMANIRERRQQMDADATIE